MHSVFTKALSVDQVLSKGKWENTPFVGRRTTKPTTVSLIAWFMRPTWGPSGADRTQVGPMLLAPWTLLSGMCIPLIMLTIILCIVLPRLYQVQWTYGVNLPVDGQVESTLVTLWSFLLFPSPPQWKTAIDLLHHWLQSYMLIHCLVVKVGQLNLSRNTILTTMYWVKCQND